MSFIECLLSRTTFFHIKFVIVWIWMLEVLLLKFKLFFLACSSWQKRENDQSGNPWCAGLSSLAGAAHERTSCQTWQYQCNSPCSFATLPAGSSSNKSCKQSQFSGRVALIRDRSGKDAPSIRWAIVLPGHGSFVREENLDGAFFQIWQATDCVCRVTVIVAFWDEAVIFGWIFVTEVDFRVQNDD